MDIISKNELEKIIQNNSIRKYSHILVCLNKETGTYFLRFVLPEENLETIKKSIENQGIYGMLSLNEQYEYKTSNKNIVPEKSLKLNISKKIQKAISYASIMHQNQYRHDGSAYINHPLRVANYVKKFKQSANIEDLYVSAILHDVIEDTEATYYDIIKLFGPQVAGIVYELTNDEDLKYEVGKTKYLEIKMKNMSSWALVIKLCDRLDNVTDLMSSTEKFRNKYIAETIEIINYLIDNRKLSHTHLKIIDAIIDRIIFTINTCMYEEYQTEINRTIKKVKRIETSTIS